MIGMLWRSGDERALFWADSLVLRLHTSSHFPPLLASHTFAHHQFILLSILMIFAARSKISIFKSDISRKSHSGLTVVNWVHSIVSRTERRIDSPHPLTQGPWIVWGSVSVFKPGVPCPRSSIRVKSSWFDWWCFVPWHHAITQILRMWMLEPLITQFLVPFEDLLMSACGWRPQS